ncbi:MAG: PDZ domain-containing protein [Planctomycetota bacterium]|nr:PDZ domain-containing protein [Planctomycetota bacterium]
MKNRLTWIVRGTVAAMIVAYATLGDPLLDALVAVQVYEQSVDSEAKLGDEPSSDEQTEVQNTGAVWKSRLVQQGGRFGKELQNDGGRSHQRSHHKTLLAFRDSVGDKWKSTVQILDRNRQVALGAIVSGDGWIVSKSSEIPDRKIEVRLFDNSKAEGTVKSRRADLDMALIKIERSNLTSIQWDTTTVARVGSWLATTDIRSLPVTIGVVSVVNRNIRRERAVLGVELGIPRGEKGALVEKVTMGSGADRAGLQAGDVITTIDGDQLNSQPDVMARLKGLMAGQRVDVGILRDGKKSLVTAQMMDLNYALLVDPTEMEVNGEISSRSTGFQNVLQHDSVIAPHQCGGPIVDVYGNAVGLNIARAGRVCSYAIPANIASAAITEMIASAGGTKSPFEDNVAQSPTKSASTMTAVELPTSIPNGIQVEALKPEVTVPSTLNRP